MPKIKIIVKLKSNFDAPNFIKELCNFNLQTIFFIFNNIYMQHLYTYICILIFSEHAIYRQLNRFNESK